MGRASFIHPAGSVTFSRAPHRPDNSLAVIQPQRKTAGAVRFGYAHTIVNKTIQLKLRMTGAEKDQLLTFFNTTVQGQSEQFAYTSPTGQAWLVRFDQAALAGILEKAWDSFEVPVRLRIYVGLFNWELSSGLTLLWDDGSTITGAA